MRSDIASRPRSTGPKTRGVTTAGGIHGHRAGSIIERPVRRCSGHCRNRSDRQQRAEFQLLKPAGSCEGKLPPRICTPALTERCSALARSPRSHRSDPFLSCELFRNVLHWWTDRASAFARVQHYGGTRRRRVWARSNRAQEKSPTLRSRYALQSNRRWPCPQGFRAFIVRQFRARPHRGTEGADSTQLKTLYNMTGTATTNCRTWIFLPNRRVDGSRPPSGYAAPVRTDMSQAEGSITLENYLDPSCFVRKVSPPHELPPRDPHQSRRSSPSL